MIKTPDNFYQEEIRGENKITTETKKVWQVQLDIVQKLLDICQTNGLKCWADGGTLIGCVREKGFIPWDDDIDMCMMREDYDKLIKLADKVFEKPYFLQSYNSDYNFRRKFARLMRLDTAAIKNPKDKHKQGIFVDIFVYDGLPNNIRPMYKHILKVKYYKSIFNPLTRLYELIPNSFSIKKRLKNNLHKKLENLLKKYSASKSFYIAFLSFTYRTQPRRRCLYDKTLYADFEYIKLPIPNGYDEVLTLCYGDYMTPVKMPEFCDRYFFDTENDYEKVRKEMLKK